MKHIYSPNTEMAEEELKWTCTSGEVFIGDPMYSKENTLGPLNIGGILSVKPGEWLAETHSHNYENKRNAVIFTWHKDTDPNVGQLESVQFGLGVSSTYACIVDNVTYDVDARMDDIIVEGTNILFMGDGITCRSGYGDGLYGICIKKTDGIITLICICFINDTIHQEHSDNAELMNDDSSYIDMIVSSHMVNAIEKQRLADEQKSVQSTEKSKEDLNKFDG
jgi:hypothetical protein